MRSLAEFFKRRKTTTTENDQPATSTTSSTTIVSTTTTVIRLDENFHKLFAIKEIFQAIVMEGYFSLPEILKLSTVCRDWFEMIHSREGFNIFMKSVIHSLTIKMEHVLPKKKNQSAAESSPVDQTTPDVFWTREHVRMCFEMMRGWSSLRNCLSAHRFKFPTNSPYPFIGDEHIVTAQRFFTPHLMNINNSVEKERMMTNCDLPKKFSDKSYCIGKLVEIEGKENNNFKLDRIYWAQKLLMYSYEEFFYLPMIPLVCKEVSTAHNSNTTAYFQSKGNWETKHSEVLRNVLNKEGKLQILNQHFSFIFGSCFDGELKHEITREIKKCSEMKLSNLPYGFQHGSFNEIGVDSTTVDNTQDSKSTKPAKEKDDFFNETLRQMLYKYLTMNLLDIPLFKEFIFTLLIYLGTPLHQAHRFSFYHDELLEGSSLAEGADDGVMEWLEEYKSNESKNYDAIYHSIVRQETSFNGSMEGEQVCSSLYVLSLKRDDTNQSCSYEFVKHLYYFYDLSGEILS